MSYCYIFIHFGGQVAHAKTRYCAVSVFPGPMIAPLNLRVSDIESTQVTVHWDSVARESIMGELKEYKVRLLGPQHKIMCDNKL